MLQYPLQLRHPLESQSAGTADGRIHRYGQTKDCYIFNFVATNTIEGHVLQRLLEKLQEIRDALENDSVFNVVGELLPPTEIERILRDYYAGKIGNADLEERLLRDVKEEHFRAICQNALEGLATKKLNLEMLIEQRARAQERRVVPETPHVAVNPIPPLDTAIDQWLAACDSYKLLPSDESECNYNATYFASRQHLARLPGGRRHGGGVRMVSTRPHCSRGRLGGAYARQLLSTQRKTLTELL